MGVRPDALRAVDLPLLESMMLQALARLSVAKKLGSVCFRASAMLEVASGYLNEHSLSNASAAIGLMWKSWELLGTIVKVGEYLRKLETDFLEAKGIGADVIELEANLSSVQADFRSAETEPLLNAVSARIGNLSVAVQRAVAEALIEQATEMIAAAKGLGINTSRHEIFLQRATEEFLKGNYGPARLFTNYPLSLRSQLAERDSGVALGLVLILALLAKKRESK